MKKNQENHNTELTSNNFERKKKRNDCGVSCNKIGTLCEENAKVSDIPVGNQNSYVKQNAS